MSLVKAIVLLLAASSYSFFFPTVSVYSEEETHLYFEAKLSILTRLILIVKINSRMKE